MSIETVEDDDGAVVTRRAKIRCDRCLELYDGSEFGIAVDSDIRYESDPPVTEFGHKCRDVRRCDERHRALLASGVSGNE